MLLPLWIIVNLVHAMYYIATAFMDYFGLNFLPKCWLMHFIFLLLKVYVASCLYDNLGYESGLLQI